MSMTSQAHRSLFLYPVQRTIRPIATIPRSANPRGTKKFSIAPKGNLTVGSLQVEVSLRAAGIEVRRQRDQSKAEIEVVLQRTFMAATF
jgi:hypothetical protein